MLTPDSLFSACVSAWLDSLRARCSPRTVVGVTSQVKPWLAAWGSLPLSAVTLEALRAYMADRRTTGNHGQGLMATTINGEMTHLRWFFGWLVKEDVLPANPARRLERVRAPKATPRTFSEPEYHRLLASAGGQTKDLVELAAETGLRRRALLGIKWSHVDLDRGILSLPGSLLKSGSPFISPLSPRALAVLHSLHSSASGSQRPEVFSIAPSSLHREFHRAMRRAGLGAGKFHWLRKYFLTRCRRRGVPLEVAMRLSDHHDLKTVLECYRAIDDLDLLRAVGRELPASEKMESETA